MVTLNMMPPPSCFIVLIVIQGTISHSMHCILVSDFFLFLIQVWYHTAVFFHFYDKYLRLSCTMTTKSMPNNVSLCLNIHTNTSWSLIVVTHLLGVTLITEVLQHPETRHTHLWAHLRLRHTLQARVLSWRGLGWLQLHFLTRRVLRPCLSWGIMGLLAIILSEER